MKNALILHGTDFDRDKNQRNNNWFPWLKTELVKRSYKVFLPELPRAWEPDVERYWNFLKNKFDFNHESVLIGHSSGATAILGIIEKLPKGLKIDSAFLVGSFIKDMTGVCGGLFAKPFHWEIIKSRVENFYIIHSDNDPYCPFEGAEEIANNLGTKVILKKGQKHFSVFTGGEKFRKLPLILEILEE